MDLALYKEITISNSYASERSSWLIALRLLEQKRVNLAPLISAQLPLADWEEGFRRSMTREELKILLLPNSDGAEGIFIV